MIMQCPVFDAHKAVSLGLVDDVFYDLEDGINQTIEIFGPIHTVTIELSRRLLNESYATDFENSIGNFLAAQHRAITQTAFLDTLKARRKEGAED
jgi:enoyl-CoA hydratase/carnithine racemase